MDVVGKTFCVFNFVKKQFISSIGAVRKGAVRASVMAFGRARIHTHTHTHTHTFTYVHTYIYTYKQTHMHTLSTSLEEFSGFCM